MINPEQLPADLVPEARAYFEAVAAARTTLDRDLEELRARRQACDSAHAYRSPEWYDAREKIRGDDDEIHRRYNETHQTLWTTHVTNSTHPLMRWIGANVSHDYRGQAEQIMAVLTPTATVSDFDEVARRGDWCYTWNEYRSRAIAADVIDSGLVLQMRVNGGPWQDFWEHQTRNGDLITKEMIKALFNLGASFIAMDVGTDNLKYQQVPADR